MSVRRAVARPAGAGDLLDEARDFERSGELAEYQKVALRLQTAFLFHPSRVDASLRADLLEHFAPGEIVELAFKCFYWSSNRPNVTLGTDAPHDESRLHTFHYAEDGEYVVHAS